MRSSSLFREPLPNTPSQAYLFDYRPVWQRIWDGTIGATLGWIASGFIAAANFLVNWPTILAQVGAWIWNEISQLPRKVASAVQAAGEVFLTFVDAIVDFLVGVVTAALAPIANQIISALNLWIEGLVALVRESFVARSPVQTIGDYLEVFGAIWSYITIPLAMIGALIVAAQAIEIILQVVSGGISGVLARVAQAAAPLFLLGAAGAAIGAVSLAFQNGITWVFVDQLGAAADFVTAAFETSAGVVWLIGMAVSKSLFTPAAGYALLSLIVTLIPPIFEWWENLMLVALALALAIVGVRDYLAGPDEMLAKVFTPFLSLMTGVLTYSAMVSVGVDIASGIVNHTIIP